MNSVLAAPPARALEAALSREAVRDLARGVLVTMREELASGALRGDREEMTALAVARLVRAAELSRRPRLRRVINATGVVLHTNLGRAPLGPRVMAEVAEACGGYATLEYDLESGRRGHRDAIVGPALAGLLGADDALVVNNCAAAVLLAATALAAGREVIVSRGELVEIGGGFRIPDVIASCGARLVEVGTTNRTRAADFERALGPATGAILRVHRSNFALVGFTEEPDVRELVALGKRVGVPVLEDLGSGAMIDTTPYGIGHERTAREAIQDGVDLVMVSGDKLMGGPQAGIIAGGGAWIERLRRHPLMRALRPGRLVTAALEATVRAFAEGRAERDVAAVAMLAEDIASVERRAHRMCAAIGQRAPTLRAGVVAVEGRVGGGTLPLASLRSWAVRLEANDVRMLERGLRSAALPVIARLTADALCFDARTVRDDEVDGLANALDWALGATGETGAAPGDHGEETE